MKPSAATSASSFNDFPIRYEVDLVRPDEDDDDGNSSGWWPPHPVAVGVTYPPSYPLESGPILRLAHANNVMQFTSEQSEQCLREMQEAARLEQGMCCVLSCLQAARDYFESGRARLEGVASAAAPSDDEMPSAASSQSLEESDDPNEPIHPSNIKPSERVEILRANMEGLEIAESILKAHKSDLDRGSSRVGKGGSWTYTIGLVGKPSVRIPSLLALSVDTIVV
jgi:RWD domain